MFVHSTDPRRWCKSILHKYYRCRCCDHPFMLLQGRVWPHYAQKDGKQRLLVRAYCSLECLLIYEKAEGHS